MNRAKILLSILFLATAYPGAAQVPDSSFGTNGIVMIPGQGAALAITRQADGKLVTAGYYANNNMQQHFQLIRHNSDGSPDNSFGTGGIVNTEINFSSQAFAIAIQPDGKILAGGVYYTGDFVNIYHAVVVRYLPDGTLDNTFGTNGIASPQPGLSESLKDMVLQPDGKILVAGAISDDIPPSGLESFMLLRLNSDGTTDSGFGNGGYTVTSINMNSVIADIALLPNGKIVAAGIEGLYDPAIPDYMGFALARYNQQGLPDSTFGTNGIVVTDVITDTPDILQSMVIQPDGKIIAAGAYGNNHYLVRYLDNGSPDLTFGSGGKAIYNRYPATLHLALTGNGKIITAAAMNNSQSNANFMLHGYLPQGTVDNSFGINGTIATDIPTVIPEGSDDYAQCLTIQPDGKIVAGGSSQGRVTLVRYTATGSTAVKDPLSPETEPDVYPNPFSNLLHLQWKATTKPGPSNVCIMNILGQRVYSDILVLKNGRNTLSLPNLVPGNYILCITQNNGQVFYKKLTKK